MKLCDFLFVSKNGRQCVLTFKFQIVFFSIALNTKNIVRNLIDCCHRPYLLTVRVATVRWHPGCVCYCFDKIQRPITFKGWNLQFWFMFINQEKRSSDINCDLKPESLLDNDILFTKIQFTPLTCEQDLKGFVPTSRR